MSWPFFCRMRAGSHPSPSSRSSWVCRCVHVCEMCTQARRRGCLRKGCKQAHLHFMHFRIDIWWWNHHSACPPYTHAVASFSQPSPPRPIPINPCFFDIHRCPCLSPTLTCGALLLIFQKLLDNPITQRSALTPRPKALNPNPNLIP